MPSSTPWTKPDTSTRPLAVIGAGVMGRRITMMYSAAGYKVNICEKALDFYDGALEYINEHKDTQAIKLGTTPAEVKLMTDLQEAVRDAWMVVEAVPEKLDLKIKIIGQVDSFAPSDCVIATNSSSLRSDQMLAESKNNYRICNGHYYMPPDQLYVEFMSCGETDPDIFPFLMEKAASAGFTPVHVKKPSTGLAFNRIWAGIKRECLLALADGVTDARTIDAMFKSWFKAEKGPCLMMDTVGLDTVYNIEVVYEEQRGVNLRAKDWLKATYVDKGNLGKKSGKGLMDEGL
jgi:3-hydroxyacyl-CoA dehydrogenase